MVINLTLFFQIVHLLVALKIVKKLLAKPCLAVYQEQEKAELMLQEKLINQENKTVNAQVSLNLQKEQFLSQISWGQIDEDLAYKVQIVKESLDAKQDQEPNSIKPKPADLDAQERQELLERIIKRLTI